MIRLQKISKRYGEKTVLKDLTLEIPEKGITCFTAPSGFGKTTLFRILLGLEKADSGSVLGTEGLRFSCAFQEPRLVPNLTALENVLLVTQKGIGRKKPKTPEEESACSAAEKLLSLLGLEGELSEYPDELSGGEKQRVSLARALIAKSDVLILDEPFTGIDEARKKEIIPLIKEAAADKPVLMTTHQEEDARALGALIVNLSRKT